MSLEMMVYIIIGLLIVISIVLIWIAYNTSPFEYQKHLENEDYKKRWIEQMDEIGRNEKLGEVVDKYYKDLRKEEQ